MQIFIGYYFTNLHMCDFLCLKYAKIAPVTQLSVHNGQPIAPTVHSSRDAVEKRATCAETLTLVRHLM